jgi:hypothetical protein
MDESRNERRIEGWLEEWERRVRGLCTYNLWVSLTAGDKITI